MTDYSFKDDIESINYVIGRLSHNPNLSDWEKGFIKSIKEYTDPQKAGGSGFLSDKQLQILSDLWEKY